MAVLRTDQAARHRYLPARLPQGSPPSSFWGRSERSLVFNGISASMLHAVCCEATCHGKGQQLPLQPVAQPQ
eukprot:13301640-Alexandrium_andersonii.AAC.1